MKQTLTNSNLFKYSETDFLEEVSEHIKSTYSQYYVNVDGGQVFDLATPEELLPFAKYSAISYLKRFGLKDGFNKKDLLKTVHYIAMMAHAADLLNPQQESKNEIK